MNEKYSEAFKLMVIEDYYQNTLGVRATALKHGLPSKNYIKIWEEELKRKKLLPENATKPVKAAGRSKEPIARKDDRTEREKQYEDKIRKMEARIAYLESLESLQPFLKKKELKSVL